MTAVGPTGTPDSILYTVQSGDSIHAIAQRYPGVTAQLIMETNGIGTTIQPGQTLTIPHP
jgi:LysM repeat protein